MDFWRDLIKTRSGKFVLVDTRWTLDHGWETMVFKANKNGEVTNWLDLDCARYDSKEAADCGHSDMVNKWIKDF